MIMEYATKETHFFEDSMGYFICSRIDREPLIPFNNTDVKHWVYIYD